MIPKNNHGSDGVVSDPRQTKAPVLTKKSSAWTQIAVSYAQQMYHGNWPDMERGQKNAASNWCNNQLSPAQSATFTEKGNILNCGAQDSEVRTNQGPCTKEKKFSDSLIFRTKKIVIQIGIRSINIDE